MRLSGRDGRLRQVPGTATTTRYLVGGIWMIFRVLTGGAFVLGIAGLVPSQAMAQHRPAGDIPGPIDSVRDLQDTAKMLFKMADTNNDGQISQKEAVDVG